MRSDYWMDGDVAVAAAAEVRNACCRAFRSPGLEGAEHCRIDRIATVARRLIDFVGFERMLTDCGRSLDEQRRGESQVMGEEHQKIPAQERVGLESNDQMSGMFEIDRQDSWS